MASSVPPMPNYVYVIARLKLSRSINCFLGGLLCHHGESDDVFSYWWFD